MTSKEGFDQWRLKSNRTGSHSRWEATEVWLSAPRVAYSVVRVSLAEENLVATLLSTCYMIHLRCWSAYVGVHTLDRVLQV
jgi:hypothetical protein